MKTAEQIIAYIEAEIAEAHELHDEAKGKDAAMVFAQLMKITTLTQLLEEITNQ
jgi:hypothetical protein